MSFCVFDIWFLPRLPVRCGVDMSVKETRGWCKRAWAKGVGVGVSERQEGQGGGGGGGGCYENSHKDRLSMIKGLVMLCKRNWRKEKKKIPQKEKSLKRGPKQDSQFLPERRIKMCSKWSHGSSEGLDCSQINQDKLMRSRAAERGNGRQQRTKARLTQLCYHLYVGSTFFFLTEWNQWQQFARFS